MYIYAIEVIKIQVSGCCEASLVINTDITTSLGNG